MPPSIIPETAGNAKPWNLHLKNGMNKPLKRMVNPSPNLTRLRLLPKGTIQTMSQSIMIHFWNAEQVSIICSLTYRVTDFPILQNRYCLFAGKSMVSLPIVRALSLSVRWILSAALRVSSSHCRLQRL